MQEPPGIAEEVLRACVQDQYDTGPLTLEFLPLGHDDAAGVYRGMNERGDAFLLKVTSRPLYTPRYLVPRYLCDQGIPSVVAPMYTRGGMLWTTLSDWTVVVYPWLRGSSSLTGMTDEQWRQAGSICRQIHQAKLPAVGFETLHRETFDPTASIQWVRAFQARLADAQCSDAIRCIPGSCWMAHRSTICTVLTSLEQLAGVLRARTLPSVLCHGDLHARNLIREQQAGRVSVIDWDEVLLAPRERDFIFVRPPHAAAFFQGYGPGEIDWVALTYFLWERVVQDLIECTRRACRQDRGDEARQDLLRQLAEILAEDRGHIHAAFQARAHLPADLTVHKSKTGQPMNASAHVREGARGASPGTGHLPPGSCSYPECTDACRRGPG